MLEVSSIDDIIGDASRGISAWNDSLGPSAISRAVADAVPDFENAIEIFVLLNAQCGCVQRVALVCVKRAIGDLEAARGSRGLCSSLVPHNRCRDWYRGIAVGCTLEP